MLVHLPALPFDRAFPIASLLVAARPLRPQFALLSHPESASADPDRLFMSSALEAISSKLERQEDLSDSDFWRFLEGLDRRPSKVGQRELGRAPGVPLLAARSACHPRGSGPLLAPGTRQTSRRAATQSPASSTSIARPAPSAQSPSDGAMNLVRRQAEIRVSEEQFQPTSFVLQQGGTLLITVRSGPPQSFRIGRDEEDVFETPAIPAGSSYTWCAAAATAACRRLPSLPMLPCRTTALNAAIGLSHFQHGPSSTPSAADAAACLQDAGRGGAVCGAQRGLPPSVLRGQGCEAGGGAGGGRANF